MRIHRNSTVLGLDKRFVPFSLGNLGLIPLSSPFSVPDADDFYNSPLFDPNPKSGLGGWGDPSDDFQITTGAFASDFERPYPVPHRIRRNFTLMPIVGNPPPTEPLNTLFTPQRIKDMVDGFHGDFVGFHSLFEGGNGSHGAIHQIVGGSVTLVLFVPFC
jgi:tyrosinase